MRSDTAFFDCVCNVYNVCVGVGSQVRNIHVQLALINIGQINTTCTFKQAYNILQDIARPLRSYLPVFVFAPNFIGLMYRDNKEFFFFFILDQKLLYVEFMWMLFDMADISQLVFGYKIDLSC